MLHGGWHATRALAHCAKIKGEGVAACHGTFGNETKAALEFLRADHLRKKAQCSPNKFAEGESTSQLRNQTAARVENDARRSSSSRASAHHDGVGTIVGAFQVSSSSNLSAAITDCIIGDALPFNLVNSPRFKRVIAAARNAPAGYWFNRQTLVKEYVPKAYATHSKKLTDSISESSKVNSFT